MDQKATETKMLALTDGKNDENSAGSSYVMMPSDRRAVSETRNSASQSNNQLAAAKAAFEKKGSIGLWWDAIGIFNTSIKKDVTDHMEKHRKFYEGVVTFADMVEKGDKESFEFLLDLYEELSIMEMLAMRDAESSKSKAICQMLRKFLDEKYKLDHNLKRVECVVLKQKINDVGKSCENALGEMDKTVQKLFEDNEKTRGLLKSELGRAEMLKEENVACKSMMETMQNKMEQICLDANKRAEEADKRAEEADKRFEEAAKRAEEADKRAEDATKRLEEKMEVNQREILKMLKKMTEGSGDGPPHFPNLQTLADE